MIRKPPKPKKCRVCPGRFVPRNTSQVVCSPACALEHARQKRMKADALRARLAKAEHRKRLREVEPISKVLERVKRACHEYIKERDHGKPCISCGLFCARMEAGHYKAVGAGGASPARFHPDNIHLQCHPCNHYNGGGNHAGYRPNLVARIGDERVRSVERLHATSIKWDRDALEQLASWFRSEARKLKKQRTGAAA